MIHIKRLILILVLAFALLCLPAASAQPNSPLRCIVCFELNWDAVLTGEGPSWIGTIEGDIEGNATLWLIEASFPGITEHYAETWVILTDTGSIEIYQKGVWSFKSFKFKSNGYVTVATGEWAYLLGADVHIRGVTTPFPVPPGTPVIGTGILWVCGFAD